MTVSCRPNHTRYLRETSSGVVSLVQSSGGEWLICDPCFCRPSGTRLVHVLQLPILPLWLGLIGRCEHRRLVAYKDRRRLELSFLWRSVVVEVWLKCLGCVGGLSWWVGCGRCVFAVCHGVCVCVGSVCLCSMPRVWCGSILCVVYVCEKRVCL